jgi:hypothetical protein
MLLFPVLSVSVLRTQSLVKPKKEECTCFFVWSDGGVYRIPWIKGIFFPKPAGL